MAQTTTGALDAVLDHMESRYDGDLAALKELLRIPSVSAQEAHHDDVQRAADWLTERLRKAGFDADQVPTSGHPCVVASWTGAGADAPTLLVYGHYDVQPADVEDGWQRPPFEPVEADGRLWGRGTTDDKGQLLCHVFAAEAWLEATGSLPVNMKFIFEGEEEMGSVHFDEALDAAADRLAADVLVVSDTPMHDEDTPAITTSLRGLDYFQVDVHGPGKDLHSGSWGGVVWNPIEALVHMLASCKDPKTGKILVPGFYDDVVAPSDAVRARFKEAGLSDQDVLEGTGARATFGEAGWTNAERIGVRPTFELNGIWGGYTGDGAKTVIPSAAHAKISCRLVADQDPHRIADQVRDHLLSVAPDGVHVEVTVLSTGDPVGTDPEAPAVQAVSRALEGTWGRPPVLLAEGGSIPPVANLQKRLGVQAVLMGFGHRDENMHAPEESFRLTSFRRGRQAAARLLWELAQH